MEPKVVTTEQFLFQMIQYSGVPGYIPSGYVKGLISAIQDNFGLSCDCDNTELEAKYIATISKFN